MEFDSFRAGSLAELPTAPTRKTKRPRSLQPFLRGPIPMEWLARAHAAGGSAVAVGLALWFVRGVCGKAGPVKLTSAVRRRLGLTPDQARRGIPALEDAGLVAIVKGGRGRCPVVEILDRPPGPDATGPS